MQQAVLKTLVVETILSIFLLGGWVSVKLYFARPDYCFCLSLTFRFSVRRPSSELMMAFLSPSVPQLPLLTFLKIISVQETEMSDLNQNNNLDARNTTSAKPGFKPSTECFNCIIV